MVFILKVGRRNHNKNNNHNSMIYKKEEKNWVFIRTMFWIGIAASAFLLVKFIIFVATYDFCPLYYGVKCF